MKQILSALLLCPLVLSAQQAATAPTAGEAPKLTIEQIANITKQLDQIETQITKNRTDSMGGALSKFKQAMAGDKELLDLYLACYKLENFDRKDLKQADFQDWKDRNDAQLKDKDFLIGLRMQLEYLILSVQAQDTKDMGTIIPTLQAYIPKAINAIEETVKRNASGAVEDKNKNPNNNNRPRQGGPGAQVLNMLRGGNVRNTVFSKAFQLDDFLKKDDWEYEPMNIAGVYTKVIFPYYEEKKPAEIPALWETRITAELVLRKATMSETEYQIYYKENQPRLYWAKANYLLNHNITAVLALADMLKIVRDNPTHPDATVWLDELRQSVNKARPAEVSPGSTQEALAPAGT